MDLSPAGQTAYDPQVALDAEGNAVAVWMRYGSDPVVQATSRAAGAPSFSTPRDLSAAGQDAAEPHVALDAAGNATAVWTRSNGSHSVVQAASRAAGAPFFSAPQDLSASGQNAAEPHVALDAEGNAIAVWRRFDGSRFVVQAASRAAGAPFFSAPQDLSASGQNAEEPHVALDAEGNAIAVWRRFNGSQFVVQAASRPAGAPFFSAPQDLSAPAEAARAPQVALDAQGNAIAIWTRFNGSHVVVQAASRAAGAPFFSAPEDLSASGQNAEEPQVALDAQGNAIAVWRRSNGSHFVVQAARRAAGAPFFSAPQDLSAAGQTAHNPQVALDADGNAIAVWTRSNGSHFVVQTASRAAGAPSFSAPQDLSAAGENAGEPQVAFDAQGNAIAVWRRWNGSNDVIQGAGYDAAGPQLRQLTIPGGGTVGDTLSFAVAPLDVWTQVASVTWDFGDATSASGNQVTHAYRTPGSYGVIITATDSLGNVTIATRTITIRAAPVRDLTAPVLSALRLSPSTFRAAPRGASIAAAIGTRLSYTLSEPAKVRFTIARQTKGRRAGRRCVKPMSRNRKARPCTRLIAVRGGFSQSGKAGRNRLRFTGRLGRRALRAGRYVLNAVATDSAGNRSKPRSTRFTIRRR